MNAETYVRWMGDIQYRVIQGLQSGLHIAQVRTHARHLCGYSTPNDKGWEELRYNTIQILPQ